MYKDLSVENKHKKRILEEKAITLISLVISIIVILILAGVTIVTLTGENGILTRTQTAVESNNASQEEELIRLAVQSAKVAGQGTITTDNLNKELRESFGDESVAVVEQTNGWNYEEYNISKNGEVKKYLPDEYQEVEYIESTGTQWIDTRVALKSTSGFYLDVIPYSNFGTNEGAGYGDIIGAGCYKGKWINRFWLSTYMGGNISNGSQSVYNVGLSKGERTQNWLINGVYQSSKTEAITISILNSTTILSNIALFAESANIEWRSAGVCNIMPGMKLYSAKIYDAQDVVRNFIPCKSTTTVTNVDNTTCPSGTIGLYDTVEGKFYTNQGSGTFIAGPDV